MADLSQQIANLSPEKRALLEKLLKQEGVGQRPNRILPVRRDGGAFPLSFAQQRLWFFDQLEPGSPLYNIPQAVRLTGRLDAGALEQALNEIVRRHEALRTTFETRDGQPVQVVAPSLALALAHADLTALPAAEREAEARRQAHAEAQRPFDLRRGPLLRASLLKLGADDHVVLLTLHHIVSDGWSIGVLLRELAILYDAYASGRPSPLPPLPIQYADFVHWQRTTLAGAPLEQQLTYWTQKLGDLPPPLELPTDRPRPAILSARGAHHGFVFPAELAAGLNALAQAEGATLFMALLAGFQILLSRYSGQTDISVGSPIANRTRAEIEPLIGVFINTLVLRTDLSSEPGAAEAPGFRALLKRVRETTLGAYAHQDLPFETLVERLHPVRDLSRTPLFQAMFVLQNAPAAGAQPLPATGLRLTPIEAHSGTATFELTLSLTDTPQGLHGALEYSTDLFDAATIERLIGHFRVLLEAAVREPDRPITRLPLLTAEERRLVLETWNATERAYPQAAGVHQLFEAQAARTPEAIAAVVPAQAGRPRQTLTYAELDQRAAQLARHLRGLGVGPESLVGLAVERSPEMLVGLLGILKAGGAYLPLDPDYPAERLAFMLQDSGARWVLTTAALAPRLPSTSAQTLCLDADWEKIAASASDVEAPAPFSPDSLAYVIYTSGSTGTPKGVLVPHRAVVNHNLAMAEAFGLTPADRVLQFATLNFDAAVEEIFPTWARGAAVVLRPAGPLLGGAELLALAEAEALTVLDLPTAYWHAWVAELETLGRPLPPSLRLVIVGGEAASAEALAAWRRLAGERVRWLNTYGPTETTVVSTVYVLDAAADPRTVPPIGRPIANVRAYLLDRHGEPVPVGVPGELYLGGLGVARGYLNRPELTAERFVEVALDDGQQTRDGFADSRPSASVVRLYKTGDLCRYRPDGNLVFVGRADEQVKIRGFRVELGEIEAALQQHPAVQMAVVVALGAGASRRLAAYIVPAAAGAAPSADELRAFLKARLPEYMLPAAWLALDQLPLTPNGKVNRRALPAPEGSDQTPAAAYVAPRTPTEELLAEVWARLLNRSRVGALDHFFDLGGHSLLATQLISRVRQTFDVELPLRAVFEQPTIAGLAEQIEAARRGLALPPLVPVPRTTPDGRPAPLPLSFAQQRLWFIDQFEPNSAQYNLPDVVRLRGTLDINALARALDEIVRRHEVLRTTFPTVDGQPVPVVTPELSVPLPIVDLSDRPEAEREAEALRLANAEARRPFDLARGPLLRATLLRLRADEHLALLTLHHIASDGWSSGVLTRELAALYSAFAAGAPSPLPPLPLQYADYAAWQRSWLHGDVLAAQLDYWRRTLGEDPPALDLPTDRPRPAVQTSRGALLPFTLDAALLQGLEALSRAEGATLFMTLLTGFQALLHRYTGQAAIHVGTPIANRTRAEVEGLIGFFVNTLVMRGDFADTPTFRQALRRGREAALGAYAHQDVPFEKLVDALQPRRDLSRPPLFQVMFILQTAARPRGAVTPVPGLTLEPLVVHMGTSNFDLTLALEQTGAGLSGAIEYNADLFDEATIARLARHFRALLAGALADPDQPVAALPLLSDSERRQILVDWNATAADFPRDRCVHHLFEVQAARQPDALAVVEAAGAALTYAELDRRAEQLAHHLRGLGVGPETLVGLAVERSPEMLVGLLGILKAGGAYLPLDPAYPPERLAFMLQDSGTRLVLTQSRFAALLPASAAQTLRLDADWPTIAQTPATDSWPQTTPDSLAYVIYTSGSTGTPKGVAVTHGNLVNHNLAVVAAFGLTPADRVLQFATLNFDTAAEEIFPTWAAGATLVLRPAGPPPSGAELRQLSADRGLTVLDLPTAYWHAWVGELELSGAQLPESLRLVVVGGEAALAERLVAWRRRAGGRVRWLNTYGPTEGTIIASLYEPREPGLDGRAIPIGRPIANAQLYILDARQQPVPVGVVGELHIGGRGVARGYLNRPELTAEKFIELALDDGRRIEDEAADGRPPSPVQRLYRTGDLARFRPDGNVEFLGRGDEQVKVRGFRIELGEVESALLAHPAVKQAAVLARGRAEKQLVACVVPADGEGAALPEQLRAHLQARLPEYMRPTAFVVLDQLPLTPNAKVDRRALAARVAEAAPDSSAPAGQTAPRNPTEETLAAVWAQVLGLPRVGVHANFFELGGDSILSIQVIARAAQAGLRLTPRQLFEHPTVAGLAAVAAVGVRVDAEQGLVTGSLPLTPIQRWFFQQAFPDPHHWNQAVLFGVRVPLDRAALTAALGDLLAHHDALRLRFSAADGGGQAQLADLAGGVPLTWIDLSDQPEAEHGSAVETHAAQAQASLNLAEGPLLRAVYFNCGAGRPARLLIVIHHLAVDGVSWRILLEDLQTAYQQRLAGAAPQLPAKTTSFKAWAERLAAYARTAAVQNELPFWLETLAPGAGGLPVDLVDGDDDVASEQSVAVTFTADETRALLQDVPRAYHTEINDALLTALAQTLTRWTGARAALIDLEGHGREDVLPGVDVSRTVGWFTSVYPVRLELRPGLPPGEALKSVKEQLRRVPGRGLGYGLLRYLAAEPALRGRPEAPVSFNYLGQFGRQAAPEAGGPTPFEPAAESSGLAQSPRAARSHRLDLNGGISAGCLRLEWTYSAARHRRATVERLAGDFAQALRDLIAHCQAPQAGGHTPSDFKLAKLDQRKLDKVLAKVGKKDTPKR